MPRCWHSILNDYESITPAMGLMLFFLFRRTKYISHKSRKLFVKAHWRYYVVLHFPGA